MSEYPEIFELLSSKEPESIRDGAHMAGMEKCVEAIPSLVENLSSSNIGVQEACERALRKIGGSEVVLAVIPLLRSEEAPVRNMAMEILRNQGTANVEAIAHLLHDEDVDVRIFASDILGSVDNPLAITPLGRALLHDPEVNVRYQAAVSLGVLGSHEAAVFLNKALKDDEWVQFSVIEALTKIRDESSVSAMITALERSSDLIASTIVDALGEMGNVKAAPLLLKRLESSPAALCNKIVRAVINILGDNAMALLGSKDSDRLRGYMEAALGDEDTDVQDAAIRGLAALGGERATRLILALGATLNPDKYPDRLAFIADSLAKIGFNEELALAFKQGDEHSQQLSLEAMGRMASDHHIAVLLIGAFYEKPRDIQRIIMHFLPIHATAGDQDFFVEVLRKHEDGIVIRSALAFLGAHGDPEAIQDDVLATLNNPYNDVKESAMEALICLHTPKIQQHFLGLLDSDDPINRVMSVYALGSIDGGKYMPQLATALHDQDALVRKVALDEIGKQPLTVDSFTLVHSAMHDESREVRMSAADIIGKSSMPEAENILVEGLEDEDQWVVVRCIEKLADRKSPGAAQPLIGLLDTDDSLVLLATVKALGKIGGENAFRSLMSLLEHPDPEITSAAEEALAVIGTKAGA